MTTVTKVDVSQINDWELIVAINCPGFKSSLPHGLKNELGDLSWEHQDGYGFIGYTPVQGWDWSGIRDSSPAAKKNIAKVLRARLEKAGISSFVSEDLLS